MSRGILIIGESGAGKTTSMRNLNPEETFYIDCDKKGLSWRGWREQYNKDKKNYIATSDASKVSEVLDKISNEQPHIKNIIIDTLNAIMIDDEFNRMKEKSFDKWQDMASAIYFIALKSNNLREDLNVICIGHAQTERDENGYSFTRMKTSGKKLDKIVPESKFTTVLLAKAVNGEYIFETHANNSTAKTPMGAFEEDTIENNITKVLEKLREF